MADASKKDMGRFDDLHGKPSAVRLMSAAALVVAGILTLATAFGKADASSELILFWLTAAFAPKVVQRFAEKQ